MENEGFFFSGNEPSQVSAGAVPFKKDYFIIGYVGSDDNGRQVLFSHIGRF